jgi:ABC-2 type transport system permease protein
MPQQYSQFKAMMAVTKASLRSTFRSGQAVFFSLFFPVVLIVIFGALSSGGGINVDVAFDKNTDTSNQLYQMLVHHPALDMKKGSEEDLLDRLQKGRITALINIKKSTDTNPQQPYTIHLKTTSAASPQNLAVLNSLLQSAVSNRSGQMIITEKIPGRKYTYIDFLLPGLIGFSLIGSAIFGVAFVFYSFRETLVLKRLYSTPIRRSYIVIGESIARITFQLMTVVVLILFGKYFYDFTLANGWITFIELLILSFLGLVVFMGFGYVISGIAKNQNVIPVYANLFMFPQYFLSGTFFPITSLPEGLQKVVRFLPLTALNDALRQVSFEGEHIWNVWPEILILVAWGIGIYIVAIRVFKWE